MILNVPLFCFVGVGIIILFYFLNKDPRQPCLVQESVDVLLVTDVGTTPDTNAVWWSIWSIAAEGPYCVPIAPSKLPVAAFLILISVPIWKMELYTSAHFALSWRNIKPDVKSMLPGSIRQTSDSISSAFYSVFFFLPLCEIQKCRRATCLSSFCSQLTKSLIWSVSSSCSSYYNVMRLVSLFSGGEVSGHVYWPQCWRRYSHKKLVNFLLFHLLQS